MIFRHFMRGVAAFLALWGTADGAGAATLRVPADYPAIQAAVDAAQTGDTVLVAPGRYLERIQLKPGCTLRSTGGQAKTTDLARAEATIIAGAGLRADLPGIEMAEGSTLDGFTVTQFGTYDEARWAAHQQSQGEELGDDEGSVQAEGSAPAISVRGVTCTVSHCIVHHNGDVGIGVLGLPSVRAAPLIADNRVFRNMGGGIGIAEGAEAIVCRNTCYENLRAGIGCRKAGPIISHNDCYKNIRAGIGCREGATPIIRRNRCHQNLRAGIGIRMEGTAPLVVENTCEENAMAGIGCRDGAAPTLKANRCLRNQMAGIGCRDGARPILEGNLCRENTLAGIGVQNRVVAILLNNRCEDNRLVAVGVIEGSTALIVGNHLSRQGGMPPILAVKDQSTATIRDNQIHGGGVAAILVQGTAEIAGNQITASATGQGKGVWVWEQSSATVAGNTITGYRTGLSASKAVILVRDNWIERFQGVAIQVSESLKPAHVFGNTAVSTEPTAMVIDLHGPAGVVTDNQVTATSREQPK